jgi:hypothetical protein
VEGIKFFDFVRLTLLRGSDKANMSSSKIEIALFISSPPVFSFVTWEISLLKYPEKVYIYTFQGTYFTFTCFN